MKLTTKILLFVFLSLRVSAQQWLGISASNYGGTYTSYLNPANIADSRYKCFVNLAGGDISILNNYASFSAPYSFVSLLTNSVPTQYRDASSNIVWRNNYLLEKTKEGTYQGFLNAEIRGPGAFYTFENSNLTIGLTSRVRVLTNLTNLNLGTARMIVEGTNQPAIFNSAQGENHFALNMNGITEIAASVGYVLMEEEKDFVKIGATVKKINGVMHGHVIGDRVDYTIVPHPWVPQRQILYLTPSVGQYGTVSDESFAGIGVVKGMLGSTAGSGLGVDVGFVYEYRPKFNQYVYHERGEKKLDKSQNKYKYRIGVALLDFGAVKYAGNLVSQVDVNIQTSIPNTVIPGSFSNTNTFKKLGANLDTLYKPTSASKTNQIIVPLPMALSVNFDYQVLGDFYVSAVWIQNLRNNKVNTMSQPSLLVITPRLETKYLDISMPVGLSNNYQNFTWGLAARMGVLFVGTDNIGLLAKFANPQGLDFYAGLFIPFYHKAPKNLLLCPKPMNQTFGQKIKSIFVKDY